MTTTTWHPKGTLVKSIFQESGQYLFDISTDMRNKLNACRLDGQFEGPGDRSTDQDLDLDFQKSKGSKLGWFNRYNHFLTSKQAWSIGLDNQ